MADTVTAQQLADAVAAHLFANDRASKALGMRIVAVSEGAAFVEMTVRDEMLNGFGICHGGIITTLADSAFAFACNTAGEVTVAAGLNVDFLAPARAGDVLTARAFEVAQAGRSGLYDVAVTNQRNEQIALVRGRAHRRRGSSVLAGDSVDAAAASRGSH